MAHTRHNSKIVLIVPETQLTWVRQNTPNDIASELRVCTVEACLEHLGDHPELARILGFSVGTLR
jgi:hypothetical protein